MGKNCDLSLESTLFKKKRFVFYVCRISVSAPCAITTCSGQKMTSNPLEQEFQTVSLHVGSENQIWVLWKGSQYF